MDEKESQTVARIILTIGIVLCGIAIIMPWGEITFGIFANGDFYTWGVQIATPLTGINEYLSSFSSDLTTSEMVYYFSLLSESSPFAQQVQEYLFHVFLSILILPLCLFSLVLGIFGEMRLTKYGKDLSLRAGVISLLTVVFFYIFIQFGMLRAYEQVSPYYDWSMGFYLMMIVSILFFISYIILSVKNIEE